MVDVAGRRRHWPADEQGINARIAGATAPDPERASAVVTAGLRSLGLDPTGEEGASITIRPVLGAPDGDPSPPWGASVRWEVEVRQGADRAVLRTAPVAHPVHGPVLAPWPVREGANVFANANGRYAVRARLRPTGCTFDDVPAGAEDSPITRCRRVVGLLPRDAGYQAGMEQTRITLSAHPGAEEDGALQIHERIEGAGGPRRERTRGTTLAALVQRLEAARRSRDARPRGRRRQRRAQEDRSLFAVEPGGRLEADLERMHTEDGIRRPASDGMLHVSDLRVLTRRLLDPEWAPTAQESVFSPSRQRPEVAADSFCRMMDANARSVLRSCLSAWPEDHDHPGLLVAPAGSGAPPITPEQVEDVTREGPSPERQEALVRIAQRVAALTHAPGRRLELEETLKRWQNGQRVVRLGVRTDLPVEMLSRGETPVYDNALADEVAENVVLGARLPDTRAGRRLHPQEMSLPADAWPAFDPMAAATNGYSVTVRATPALAFDGAGPDEGARPLGVAARTPGGEVVVPLAEAAGLGSAPEGEQPWLAPEDTLCAERADLFLPGARAAAREAISVRASRHALSPGQPRTIRTVGADGREIEGGSPTFRLRVALVKGEPGNHEDAILMSRSCAESLRIRIPRHVTRSLDPGRTPGVRWRRPANADERAEAIRQTGTRGLDADAIADRFDENGVIREGLEVQPGDPIRIWSEDGTREGPQGPEAVVRWFTEPFTGNWPSTVRRMEWREGAASGDAASAGNEAGSPRTTLRILTETEQPPETLDKLQTMSGCKGILIVREDADMPHTEMETSNRRLAPEAGEEEVHTVPVDVAIEEGGIAGRAGVGDLYALRLGHLVERRTMDMLNASLELAAACEGAPGGATAAEAAEAAGPLAAGALRHLEEMRAAGAYDALHVGAPGGRGRPLSEVLTVGGETPAEEVAAATEALERACFGPDDPWSGGGSMPVLQQALERVHVRIPAGAGTAQARALCEALAYRIDEEHTVASYDGAGGGRYLRPCAAGMMDVRLTDNLGRDVSSCQRLGESRGPRSSAKRIGVMEATALRASGAHRVLAEAYATSEQAQAAQARDAIEEGRPWEPDAGVPGGSEARTRAGALAAALGLRWEGSGRMAGMRDGDVRREFPVEVAAQEDGTPAHRRIDRGDRQHVALARPVLHTAFARHAADLLGVRTGELVRRCTAADQAEQAGLGPTLLAAALPARPGEEVPHAPGGNAPAQVARLIEAAVEAALNDGAGLMRRVRAQAERIAEDPASQVSPVVLARHVQAVEALVERGEGADAPYVVSRVPVAAQALRRAHDEAAVPHGMRPRDRLDRMYQRLIETNERIVAADRTGARTPGATRDLAAATAAVHTEVGRRLGGKRGIINRRLQGCSPGVGAYLRILPDETGALAPDEVRLPRSVAVGLYEPWIVGQLRRNAVALGDPALADRETARRVVRRAGTDPGHRHYAAVAEALQGAVQVAPVVCTRYPALHRHNVLALEVSVHDDPLAASGSGRTETECLRIHPALCAPVAGDFDGDTMSLTVPITPAAAEEARARLGAATAMRKAGDGSPQMAPTHAAREGAMALVAAEGAEGLVAAVGANLAAEDTEAQAVLARIGSGLPRAGTAEAVVDAFDEALCREAGRGRAALRVLDSQWRAGFEAARERVAPVRLSEYEALAEICESLKPRAGKGPRLEERAGMRERLRFARRAAERHQGWSRLMQAWARDPESLTRLAVGTLADRGAALAERAGAALKAAAGGARLKTRELVRMCAEVGAVRALSEVPLGHYAERSIVGGQSAQDLRSGAVGGGNTELSNHAFVGLAGYTGQRITQAMAGCRVVEEDCGTGRVQELPAAQLARVNVGQSLAEPMTLDGRRIERVEEATVERLRERGGVLRLRTIAGCEAEGGICGTCCGALAATGARPEPGGIGADLGELASTSVNEKAVQPIISAFHADSVIVSARIRAHDPEELAATGSSTEALLDVLGDGRSEPSLGQIYGEATDGGAMARVQAPAVRLMELLQEFGIEADPTLVRSAAAALVDRGGERMLTLDEAARRHSPGLYAASGSPRGERALGAVAAAVVSGQPLETLREEDTHAACEQQEAGVWQIRTESALEAAIGSAGVEALETPDPFRPGGPTPLDRLRALPEAGVAGRADRIARKGREPRPGAEAAAAAAV